MLSRSPLRFYRSAAPAFCISSPVSFLTATKEAVHAGFGGPLTGMVVGGVIGGTASDRLLAPLAGAGVGGLLGLGAELIGGELVKKVTYSMIVDVQLSEKSDRPVTQRQTANFRTPDMVWS